MKMQRITVLLALLWAGFSALPAPASANKSAVAIQAPTSAAKGSEIIIRLTVTHNGNNRFHYTERVTVTANGRELGRWSFTGGNRPEAEVFTREVRTTVNEALEIQAEASCNLHGSAGPATASVALAP